MNTILKKIIPTFLVSLFLTACSPIYMEDTYDLETTIDNVNYSNLEFEILKKVNLKRTELNINSLSTYNIISSFAQEHTELMLYEGQLMSANKEERLNTIKELVNATAVAEIISFSEQSADDIIEKWMNNENGENILLDKKFTKFGISIEPDATGINYITFFLISDKSTSSIL